MAEDNNKNNNDRKERIRVVTFLCRNQLDYLDRMGKDAMFRNGKKLSRAQILSGLVETLIKTNISVKRLRLNNGDFSSQLLKALHGVVASTQRTEDREQTNREFKSGKGIT